MTIPQFLILGGAVVNVALACAAHGTPRSGRWNAWHNVIAVGALLGVLIAGGFFA